MEINELNGINYITGLTGKIVLFEDGGYVPLLTIILNGNEKIYYKDYSILHILDVTVCNPNDDKSYSCDVKLYDNIVDLNLTSIPCSLKETRLIVNCRRNEFSELFSIIMKG